MALNNRRLTRRRSQGRRYRAQPLTRTVCGGALGGFPSSITVRLRYCERVNFVVSIGGSTSYVWRANGPNDPNYTGVGHQPSNYTVFADQYARCNVLRSHFKAQVSFADEDDVHQMLLMAKLSHSGSDLAGAHSSGGVSAQLEQPNLTYQDLTVGVTAAQISPPLELKFSQARFFGASNAGYYPYSSLVDANPTDSAFYELAASSPDDSNTPGTVNLRVQIDYWITFAERKPSVYG